MMLYYFVIVCIDGIIDCNFLICDLNLYREGCDLMFFFYRFSYVCYKVFYRGDKNG